MTGLPVSPTVAGGIAAAVLLLVLVGLLRVRSRRRDLDLSDLGDLDHEVDVPLEPRRFPTPAPVPAGGLPPSTATPHEKQEPMSHDLPPLPATDTAEAHTGYAELSRHYAEQGRAGDAALAQWAADLVAAAPLLDAVAEQLPDAQTSVEAASHRATVTAVRDVAVAMVPEQETTAVFSSVEHLADRPVAEPAQPTREQVGVNELLDRAAERMASALDLADTDPATARRHAREADLASFEALLLESALMYGDTGLVTVDLRLDLATAVLADDDPTAPADEPLADAVARTRRRLRGLAAPHERETLDFAFVPAAPVGP
ncbi:hypothetical protein [Nocardioides sambongensis]|uniref:hypothetical protein n=1 Tax=Nocardioides sambongensis TaxID=2589074 RepID=UPI00112CF67F|nr:hypothetical protein [Nocardioides sambongensis]